MRFLKFKKMLKGAMVLLGLLCGYSSADAVVACPDPAVVTQPDGSTLTLLLHGDEWFSFSTTADGFTVVKDADDGYYKYAALQNNELVAGTIVAHDATMRTPVEKAALATTTRYLAPDAKTVAAKRAKRRLHGNTGRYDYKNFRGLVILVAYNDCPFVFDDAHTLFNDMINQKDYKGFMSNAQFPELIPYTGSVRDYFYSSSAGEFDPAFDVVGPVTIDYSQYDARQSNNAQALVEAALDAADSLVNYKDYDRDGDGTVDMVFFLFAGGGSNFSGNDSRLLWPHASTVLSKSLDGVRFGRYACSTELYGRPQSKIIDGIGTICHEFSHVLGIADLYDTDGTGSGGSSVTPGKWTLMAQGSYLNQSRTPCAYSAYERYAAGFSTPEKLNKKGTYTVSPITSSNKGYRLDSNTDNEFFLLESRKQEGWDAYLPGEGMLIWRVDSTNADVWEYNKVNCNPKHSYYQLLRATGGTIDSDADPFPGTGNVTDIGNTTSPNLCSWNGRMSDFGISEIARSADGSVSFKLAVQQYETQVEDFEDVEVDGSTVKGKFTTWTLKNNAKIAATAGENAGNGQYACSMLRSSELVSDTLAWEVNVFSYRFFNPTSSTSIVRTYYRQPGATAWTSLKDETGVETVTVRAGTNVKLLFTTVIPKGSEVRILEYTGNRTAPCYVDDITFVRPVEDKAIVGDLNGDGNVDVTDVTMLINAILGQIQIEGGDLNGDGNVDVTDVTSEINIVLGSQN